MSRNFCQDVPEPGGCSKSLRKKNGCAHFSAPKPAVLMAKVIATRKCVPLLFWPEFKDKKKVTLCKYSSSSPI